MKRNVNKKECSKCGSKFHPGILWRHEKFCGTNKKTTKKIQESWKNDNGNYQCPYCNKEFSVYGIMTHIYKKHTENGQKQDPNIGFKNGNRIAWNKNKKTPDDVKKKISKSLLGKPGTKHTKESKEKISKARIKSIKDGNTKRWQCKSGESYPEKYFNEVLLNEGLDFSRQYHIYNKTSKCNYFLDFYFEDHKVNLEIDGSQHKWEDRMKSDSIRDEYLTSIGIRVIRIDWGNPNNPKIKKYFRNKIKELKKLLQ